VHDRPELRLTVMTDPHVSGAAQGAHEIGRRFGVTEIGLNRDLATGADDQRNRGFCCKVCSGWLIG